MNPSDLSKTEQDVFKAFNLELNRIDREFLLQDSERTQRLYFSQLEEILSKTELSNEAIRIMRQSALMRSFILNVEEECSLDVCEGIYDEAVSMGELSSYSFISISLIRARYLAEGGQHEKALGILNELESFLESQLDQFANGEAESLRNSITDIRRLMPDE